MRPPRPLLLVALAILAGGALAGCLGGGGSATPVDDPARASGIVFHNGHVWTGDDTRPRAGAVAVVGDRIVAVGHHLSDVRGAAGERPYHYDLGGGMLLPGFHDTHNHFLRSAWNHDPDGSNPYEPWPPGWDPVLGPIDQQLVAISHMGSWAHQNLWRVGEGRLPEPPHGDDHGGGDAHTHAHSHAPDHVAAHGRGAANDLGFAESWRSFPAAQPPPMLDLAQSTAARFGITSHVEAGAPLATWRDLQALDASGLLTARYHLYLFPEDLDEALALGLVTGNGTASAQVLGLKIYTDGWLGPRTAALRDLYNDRPHRGFIFWSQEEVDDLVLRAHQGGLKLTAHTIGDRAVARLLDAYEQAARAPCDGHAVCTDPRWSLEHTQLVGPDLLDRFVALGVVPSIQFSFATSDSHWAESALGAARLAHSYPWQTFLDAGLRVGGSSDWPIEVLPPLWGIERMVTRQEVDGSLAAPFMPEQAVALDAVLRMATVDAAYLAFREHELGTIAPGMLADLVVLESDLFEIATHDISATRVLLTMVGGRIVHTAPP